MRIGDGAKGNRILRVESLTNRRPNVFGGSSRTQNVVAG
jgi:hypothetical protein